MWVHWQAQGQSVQSAHWPPLVTLAALGCLSGLTFSQNSSLLFYECVHVCVWGCGCVCESEGEELIFCMSASHLKPHLFSSARRAAYAKWHGSNGYHQCCPLLTYKQASCGEESRQNNLLPGHFPSNKHQVNTPSMILKIKMLKSVLWSDVIEEPLLFLWKTFQCMFENIFKLYTN